MVKSAHPSDVADKRIDVSALPLSLTSIKHLPLTGMIETAVPPVLADCYDTHQAVYAMRTNIVLDEDLVREAMALVHAGSKREVVEIALRELVGRRRQVRFLDLPEKELMDPAYDIRAVRAGMKERDHANGAG